MYFSGRHYSALNRVYSEMFAPMPQDVLKSAAQGGKPPLLLQALYQAVKLGAPIRDWTPYVGLSKVQP
jgi:hypothetical protein